MPHRDKWVRLNASRTETQNENLTVGLILILTTMFVTIVGNS